MRNENEKIEEIKKDVIEFYTDLINLIKFRIENDEKKMKDNKGNLERINNEIKQINNEINNIMSDKENHIGENLEYHLIPEKGKKVEELIEKKKDYEMEYDIRKKFYAEEEAIRRSKINENLKIYEKYSKEKTFIIKCIEQRKELTKIIIKDIQKKSLETFKSENEELINRYNQNE